MNHGSFNRPIDHQSTSNDRLKPVMTAGLVNMHIDRSIANLVHDAFGKQVHVCHMYPQCSNQIGQYVICMLPIGG